MNQEPGNTTLSSWFMYYILPNHIIQFNQFHHPVILTLDPDIKFNKK